MRVRDWLWVLLMWSLSVSAFHFLYEAIEHRNWWFAVVCAGTGWYGCYLSLSHWHYRSRR